MPNAEGESGERTLVLIKPDNFLFPTGRPGNVIDFFSRTNLSIVAIAVHRMSTAQAMEFYGPVREILRTKLKEVIGAKSAATLESEFGFQVPEEVKKSLGELLGPFAGKDAFQLILVEELIKAELDDRIKELIKEKIFEEWAFQFVGEGVHCKS